MRPQIRHSRSTQRPAKADECHSDRLAASSSAINRTSQSLALSGSLSICHRGLMSRLNSTRRLVAQFACPAVFTPAERANGRSRQIQSTPHTDYCSKRRSRASEPCCSRRFFPQTDGGNGYIIDFCYPPTACKSGCSTTSPLISIAPSAT